eukprot:m.173335 g.173335  ORF g.173335 m.173335 type:complete len:63 (-) comp13680_c0_seq1:2756-2944(-)
METVLVLTNVLAQGAATPHTNSVTLNEHALHTHSDGAPVKGLRACVRACTVQAILGIHHQSQ